MTIHIRRVLSLSIAIAVLIAISGCSSSIHESDNNNLGADDYLNNSSLGATSEDSIDAEFGIDIPEDMEIKTETDFFNTGTNLDEIEQMTSVTDDEADLALDSDSEHVDVGYLNLYKPVFDNYSSFFDIDESNYYADFEEGIGFSLCECSFLCRYYHNIGYAFLDIDDNGICELIIASPDARDLVIFDLYTLVDNVPQRILISWERKVCYLLDDMCFFSRGSDGASSTTYCLYSFSDNSLEIKDRIQSSSNNDNTGIEWFRTTTKESEFTDDNTISDDEVNRMLDDWISRVYLPELTLFVSE